MSITDSAATGGVPAPDTALSRAADRPRRRVLGWLALVVAILIAGSALALLAGDAWSPHDTFDPDGYGAGGTHALVEVLREQGVEVTVAHDREDAEAALGYDTTLVLPDPVYLSDDAVTELIEPAGDVVAIDATARMTRILFPDADTVGYGDSSPIAPGCALAEAERSGDIVAGALLSAPAGVTGCYPASEGYALLVEDRDGARVALIDGSQLFTNRHLADDGNAALAVNLMARHSHIVWYVPSLEDTDLAGGDPTLGELTPPWVTPVLVLLAIAATAAAVWRGRRFGPLVAENLPVTVRASETMEGRARLYSRAEDPGHAAAVIRAGALARMAKRLSLSAAASAPEVADAAADRLGVQRSVTREIIDAEPRSDAELVRAGSRLRDLEAAVDAAVRTERNTP